MAADPAARPRRALASIRVRTTLLATAFVAAALVIGAIAFVTIIDRALTAEVLTSLRTRAADLTLLVENGVGPVDLVGEESDDEFLQVVDRDGRVLAATSNLGDAGPLTDVAPGSTARVGVPDDDETFLALVHDASREGSAVLLIIGRTLEPVAETTELIARVLVVGLPLVLALVAGTTWLVVGRSLAPVERMRREVDGIGASDLHRRVERPASDDEIGRLAITMNRMLDRLEASQVRQRQLVADTSHELRSPIAAIRQNVEVALTHPDRIDPGALSAAVLADAERLQALVDDLLVLATIDEQSPTLRSRPVDLDDLALAEGRRLRSSTTHRVDLTGVSAARTRGDPVALARVLRNLAENAARHARSRIALTTRTLGGWAVVAVEDDGSGIPPADRERIFERFVRLDDARARDSGGGGLGLAIVRDVVAAHGGVVTAGDSSLGGARLEVRLPTADAA